MRQKIYSWITVSVALLIAACGGGGGGGGGSPPPPKPGTVQMSVAALNIAESSGHVTVSVTRTGGTDGAIGVTFATASSTATTGSDFTAISTTVSFANGDATAKTVDIAIINDTLSEPDEIFTVSLSAPTGGAALGNVSTTITIKDDDSGGHALNDTGVTTCANVNSNGLACNTASVGTDQYPRQDAEFGRDKAFNNNVDGVAGFAFIKLGANGAPLADQTVSYATNPWICLLDQVTGLVWEIKTNDNGLRDKHWTYSWYNSTGINDGGYAGNANVGVCDKAQCDTEKFIAAVNVAALCGRNDWRLPTRSEILSLNHYGISTQPFIDGAYFPEAVARAYWSSSAVENEAWSVSLADGALRLNAKSSSQAVRLVSDRGML